VNYPPDKLLTGILVGKRAEIQRWTSAIRAIRAIKANEERDLLIKKGHPEGGAARALSRTQIV
jgi:hypothetical protein